MPVLCITTNITKTAFSKEETVLALSKIAAKLSGKPESYVNVIINTDAIMSFGGTTEPTAAVEFSSIGGFTNNSVVAKELTDAISKHLKVSADRFYIKLTDLSAKEISYRGNTFG
uniref:Macrophage migration inhibitory factor n=1 Tax=Panagrolaimus sp. PS1159 TaxID=55785 RepID=A0AC35GU85_9BILA